MGLLIDCFAGGGGASTGIETALGRKVDIAINHSADALTMHKANHPETLHFCEDIFEVNPRQAVKGMPVDLAWFSPDCFPAGTVVLTRNGYKNIETIQVGDEVLTHRHRYRKVTSTMSTTKRLFKVVGYGHEQNHPGSDGRKLGQPAGGGSVSARQCSALRGRRRGSGMSLTVITHSFIGIRSGKLRVITQSATFARQQKMVDTWYLKCGRKVA